MSLRDSYFTGPQGLNSQMDAAFQAGIAFVGAGSVDISTLSLGDRNGSNLAAGNTNPGLYFTYASPSANYAMWMYVNGEVAPTVANATLIQVTILSGDNGTQVAAKIAAAMNAIAGEPLSCISAANVVEMQNNSAGVVLLPVSVGTLGGTAAVAQSQAGVAPTGNFTTLQNSLSSAAAQGQLEFRVLIQGTGSANAAYLRGRNGHNLYLSAFFAGILQALADEEIYDYQVSLALDISTVAATNVLLHFNFGNPRHWPAVTQDSPQCLVNFPCYGRGGIPI